MAYESYEYVCIHLQTQIEPTPLGNGCNPSLGQLSIVAPPPHSCSVETQRAGLDPELLAEQLEADDQEEGKGTDGRLNAEAGLCPLCLGPGDLEVGNDEAAGGTAEVDPRRNLARGLRVAVEVVRVEADGGDHDAEDVQAPEDRGHHVVVAFFESEAQPDQSRQHKRGREPHGPQANLGLEMPPVAFDVSRRDEVMEPVTDDLAQERADNGGEVEEPDLLGAKVVQRRQKDGQRRVDAHDPCKGQEIVDA